MEIKKVKVKVKTLNRNLWKQVPIWPGDAFLSRDEVSGACSLVHELPDGVDILGKVKDIQDWLLFYYRGQYFKIHYGVLYSITIGQKINGEQALGIEQIYL